MCPNTNTNNMLFEYYSNNTLFVFVFGHNSEPEYYSYSYSAKYLCTNIIRIRIRSFWEKEYYSYSYSVKILIPNIIRIRIRSKKQYSLTSAWHHFFTTLGILAPLHKHLQSLSFYCILFLNSTCFFFTVSMRIAICCHILKYKIWRSLNQSKFS